MNPISFADAEHAGKRKKTRREVFLAEMELVVPWKALLKVIEPHYPWPVVGVGPIRSKRCFGCTRCKTGSR
jgi:IS5 family transposase